MKVCTCCFKDSELINFIKSNSEEKGKCDYCSDGISSELIEVGELLDFFYEFINLFKIDKGGVSLVEIINNEWKLFSDKVVTNDILTDILNGLKIHITNPTECVSYVDEIIESFSYWNTLKRDLKTKRRFLTDIDEISELGWDGFFNEQIKISDNQELYRARIHNSEREKPYEKSEMGAPPQEISRGGRANPDGIPYLYLSKSIETTFYETRASYLDELTIASFKKIDGQEIVLVDFTEEISTFKNIGDLINHAKSMLLKKQISIDLSKPKRRYDSELEYIPTQFICEFIRYITDADGILFDSSLHIGGKNIVLFEENKVECILTNLYRISKIDIQGELK